MKMSAVTRCLFLVLSCVEVIVCEPQCSPFHYHEQLLEKMVEMKHQMAIHAEKMGTWEKVMAEKLALLDENLLAHEKLEQKLLDRINNYQKESGSVYVRWGRNTCPPSASIVYAGYTAGKHYNQKGGGTNNLCLPSDPTWSKFVDGNSVCCKAYIYGTEIDTDDGQKIFDYPANQQDLPCAVCRAAKSSTVMIPGRNNCYGGWNIEYHGYLMAGHHIHNAYEHVCVDKNPEFMPNGGTNNDEHILYFVEGQCGSLPCPPYVNGRELTCVVCSI